MPRVGAVVRLFARRLSASVPCCQALPVDAHGRTSGVFRRRPCLSVRWTVPVRLGCCSCLGPGFRRPLLRRSVAPVSPLSRGAWCSCGRVVPRPRLPHVAALLAALVRDRFLLTLSFGSRCCALVAGRSALALGGAALRGGYASSGVLAGRFGCLRFQGPPCASAGRRSPSRGAAAGLRGGLTAME